MSHGVDWLKPSYIQHAETLVNAYVSDMDTFLESIQSYLNSLHAEGLLYSLSKGELDLNNYCHQFWKGTPYDSMESILDEHGSYFFEKLMRRLIPLVWLNKKYYPDFSLSLTNPWLVYANELLQSTWSPP